jgi:hypothetical protein
MEEISMLRVTDGKGDQLVLACFPAGAEDLISVGEEDSWTEDCQPITSVIITASDTLQLTNPKDISALAAWLSAASIWLKTRQLLDNTEEL